jgi:hypothetical protein
MRYKQGVHKMAVVNPEDGDDQSSLYRFGRGAANVNANIERGAANVNTNIARGASREIAAEGAANQFVGSRIRRAGSWLGDQLGGAGEIIRRGWTGETNPNVPVGPSAQKFAAGELPGNPSLALTNASDSPTAAQKANDYSKKAGDQLANPGGGLQTQAQSDAATMREHQDITKYNDAAAQAVWAGKATPDQQNAVTQMRAAAAAKAKAAPAEQAPEKTNYQKDMQAAEDNYKANIGMPNALENYNTQVRALTGGSNSPDPMGPSIAEREAARQERFGTSNIRTPLTRATFLQEGK